MPGTIDPVSGNEIRRTENTMREDDIFSPQDPEILELDPETGMPTWWEKVKAKRGDLDGDR